MRILTIELVPLNGTNVIYIIRLPKVEDGDSPTTEREKELKYAADNLCAYMQRYGVAVVLPHDVQLVMQTGVKS